MRQLRPRPTWTALLAVCATGLGPAASAAPAQYFGRNKVQYEEFRFEVLKTDHFDVYFYPAERAAAEQAARMAERWYARFTTLLGHELSGRQPLILYASHPEFEQTNAISGELGEGTGGVTEVLKRRIVLPLAGSLAETDHVIGHELVHAFQFDVTAQGRSAFATPTAARLPLWFVEGMAEYLSLGPVDAHTAMWLRAAALNDKLPTVRQLGDPRYFPYRYGQAFWAYLAGQYGDSVVGDLLKAAGRTGNAESALWQVTRMAPDTLSRQWHAAIHAAYDSLSRETRPPTAYGHLLIGGGPGAEAGGELNVAPALSPDGTELVFFSSRDLFSIDLYLADARTGAIRRRILKTALDPHYQSLEFINSSGAWDPAGRRLAFGAVANGKAVLSLLDVERNRIEREIPFPELGEIFNPTWSPDGRAVAFAALANGVTDLFVYYLEPGRLERLTDDAYADFEPVWSPDGRTIAFVTDRFSTSLGDLRYGAYELALLDVATGAIRPLAGFPGAKHIDPQWAPDGRSLYFISDRGGISNVYRLDVQTGERFQVTDLYTGASGITPLSPAVSVARRAGRLVFSVYEAAGYQLYAVDSSAALAGRPVRAPFAGASPALLPPQDRPEGELLPLLRSTDAGLPADTGFPVVRYRSRLSLDYVAPATVAVGADRFGAFVGGGTALFWSDMLGDHSLATMMQISGGFRDLAALVAYQNTHRRWNWGVAAQQIPYLTGSYGSFYAGVGADTAYVEQVYLFRQTNRELAGLVAYPFNRVQRVEFSAGFRNIGIDRELRTRATSIRTGLILFDSTVALPVPGALSLASVSAALVYDNTFLGATSPILGQRYRLEFSPSVGTITLYGVLADYRRYVMPARPFTLAGRLLHYGRYGSGADDARLAPLFLGYPSLVRGYELGSFSAAECPVDFSLGCPAIDRLIGSRLLVGNVELRFPLLGALGVGPGFYGALPIEAAVFADGGVAWQSGAEPSLFGGDRRPVYSAGVALRINLLGYAIGEIDFVRPFDRPDTGWRWEFSLTPGF